MRNVDGRKFNEHSIMPTNHADHKTVHHVRKPRVCDRDELMGAGLVHLVILISSVVPAHVNLDVSIFSAGAFGQWRPVS